MRSWFMTGMVLVALAALPVISVIANPARAATEAACCAVRVADFGPGGWWSYDRPQWTTPTLGGTGDAHGNFKHAAFDSAPLTELVGCVGVPLPEALRCGLAADLLPRHCVRAVLPRRYASAMRLFSGGAIDLGINSTTATQPYLVAWAPPASTRCGASAGGINMHG